MTLIVSKYSMVLDGDYIHYTRMTAEQETMWRNELNRIESQKAPRTRKTGKKRNSGGGSPARTFNASAVLARCLIAQIDRKNEIPMDGMAPSSPTELTGRDYYGV
jgi:hypothetical protein